MSKEFKQERRILCVDDCSVLPAPHSRSIWPLPEDQTCLSDSSSFELLGTIQKLDSSSLQHSADQHSITKLHQAVQVVGLVLGYHPLTVDQGLTMLGTETMGTLSVAANMFSLSEQSGIDRSASESLWQHSLRTASLAGHIAKHEQAGRETVLHACIAGIFHDIGLLVLVMLESDRYEKVIVRAQKQNRSLASVEEEVFNRTHHTVGGSLLQKMKFPDPIVEAVAYHDEPFQSSAQQFSALTAVYAANILDGGGWPQDSDGMPSAWEMEYLASHGLADRWPIWREYSLPCQEWEQWRV